MRISTIVPISLFGFGILVFAAPHSLENSISPERSVSAQEKRGMIWVPRNLQQRKNTEIVQITDITEEQITEVQRGQEVQLTVLVEKKITEIRQTKNAKDNVRKNHFAAKNKNANTIITVITQIIDVRDVTKNNTRYMSHQVRADNGAAQDISVQVTEIKQLLIVAPTGSTAASPTGASQDAAASAGVVAAMQTVPDASAPYVPSNQTVLLPAGASAPVAQNVELDPAAIVEEAQTDLFVEQVTA